MDYSVTAANEYVLNNKCKVDGKYRLKFHMMPPVGWMNDPNGLCVYNGEYHLFYQYYPYDVKSGAMHWGHFVSSDLISYRDEEIALAPERRNMVSGCFSGGAIPCGDKLYLVYTNHYENGKEQRETVYLAESDDGVRFTSSAEPVFDNEQLPSDFSRRDFRDPYPVKINGKYYLFIGGKNLTTDEGVIIVLKSDTLRNFKYAFALGPFYELGNMAECPSYTRIDGRDVLLVCGCGVKERDGSFKNVNSSVFIIGKIDFEKGEMAVDEIREIDKGETFYAPQCITGQNDVMVGWFEMWDRPYPTADLGHNWVGALSIPRKLFFKDGTLHQLPVDGIKKYYKRTYAYDGGQLSRTADITIKFSGDFKTEFKAVNGSFTVGCTNGKVFMDSVNANNKMGSVRYTSESYPKGEIRIISDISGVEIFVDGGREAISTRVYLDSDYTLKTDGNAEISVSELSI